jgi:hypothetical protein
LKRSAEDYLRFEIRFHSSFVALSG